MFRLIIILIALLTFGCEGPVGPEGPEGPQGPAADNVESYILYNPYWEPTGSALKVDISDLITDLDLKIDAFIFFVKPNGDEQIYPVPGLVWDPNKYKYKDFAVYIENNNSDDPQVFCIVSKEENGAFTSNSELMTLDWVRLVIIRAE